MRNEEAEDGTSVFKLPTEELPGHRLYRVESCTTAVADFQHTLERAQVEIRIRVLCDLGKLAEQTF